MSAELFLTKGIHMTLKKFVAASVLSLTLVGCTNPDGSPSTSISKSDFGTLLGGVGGAAVGSQFGKGKGQLVGVAVGTLLGAGLGNQIGASLDRADLAYYNNVSQRTLETAKTGSSVSWQNPDSGTSGQITPTRTYQANGSYCREYTQTILVGGRQQEGHGTACRQPDGSWQITQ